MKQEYSFYRIAVKMKAKELLARNFFKTAGAVLAYVAMGIVLSGLSGQAALRFGGKSEDMYLLITGVGALLSMLLCSPLMVGVHEYCIGLTKGEVRSGWDVFAWFGEGGRLWRSLALSIGYTVICVFWAFVGAIPASLLIYFWRENPGPGIFALESLLIFAGGVFAAYRSSIYQGGFFLLAEDPKKGPVRCLKEARKMLRAYRWPFFIFTASFLPWFFISSFTFGILLIYLYPYFCLSQILFIQGCRIMKGRSPVVRFFPDRMPEIWALSWEDPPEEPPEGDGSGLPPTSLSEDSSDKGPY